MSQISRYTKASVGLTPTALFLVLLLGCGQGTQPQHQASSSPRRPDQQVVKDKQRTVLNEVLLAFQEEDQRAILKDFMSKDRVAYAEGLTRILNALTPVQLEECGISRMTITNLQTELWCLIMYPETDTLTEKRIAEVLDTQFKGIFLGLWDLSGVTWKSPSLLLRKLP